ncbi:sulfite exporter TauE/SafE family protein [Azospirillum sp. ST 5-10]|uniref:sulfite exporter TauE/SafE family protein n=1 Tax=unclassified Azospirillum TaxID=2630922 RepID=UPI003F4A6941
MDMVLVSVVAGAAAAGFVQGLSGFAFGLTAMAFWAWTLSPQLVGPVVVFGSLVGQLLCVRTVRLGFSWRRILPFVAGGAAGVPVGTLLLHHLDADLFRLGVGLLLVVYCPIMLFARAMPRIHHGGRAADAGVGWIGGVMCGVAGLPGPAPTIWCTLRGWDRDSQRATFQTFNLAMHALTFVAYIAAGAVTAEALHLFALVLPAVLLPALAGAALYTRFSEQAFRRVVLGLLLLSGVVMLGQAVAALV